MVGMMWTGGAAPPVLPVSDRRKAGTSVPPRLKGDIDMFTLTRILTSASAGELAESPMTDNTDTAIVYKKLREAAQDSSCDEPLAGYEDSVWTRAIVGLVLAGIAIWAGFVVS